MLEETKRQGLFNMACREVQFPNPEFEQEVWPAISNFWAQTVNTTNKNGEKVIYYCCWASQNSASRRSASTTSAKKKRNTSVRKPIKCTAGIVVRYSRSLLFYLSEGLRKTLFSYHDVQTVLMRTHSIRMIWSMWIDNGGLITLRM